MTDTLTIHNNKKVTTVSKPKDTYVTLKVAADFKTLAELQPEWDAFVETTGGESFLTYDRCRVWWKYYGGKRELKILVFWHQQDVVAIIPLFFETVQLGPVRVRIGKIVGTHGSLSNVNMPIRKEFIAEVIRKFARVLREYRWDVLDIGFISGRYADFELLQSACQRYFWPACQVDTVESNVEVKNLCIRRRKPIVRIRVWLFRVLARLLHICYYKIWFRRLAPKPPFKHGPLWRVWRQSKALTWI
jgi:hypothetical protein